MRIVDLASEGAEPITQYDSTGASSAVLAHGQGAMHAYHLEFTAGGEIGPHPTGFEQILLVTSGAGWVAGADGERRPIRGGQYARFSKGELHAKGSDSGMTALMIQVETLDPS